jgi:hypothetical protein
VLGRWTRDAEATLLFESFFVAAVCSFLGIRWFLASAGYAQVGSNGLHIAHMLWGGLFMLFALMLLFAFLDRSVQHLAAVIAGLGFGTFIDEIGKFVTADNNYFYRPAIALIYCVFVIAFLLARTLIGRSRLSESEALANALDLLAETPGGPIEPDDRTRIGQLLELADPKAALAVFAKQYVADLPVAAERTGLLGTVRRQLADGYEGLMSNPLGDRVLSVAVIAYAALAVVAVALVTIESPAGGVSQTSSFAVIMQLASTIAGAALVGRGVLNLPSSRMAAYHWFMRGLLVWILVTQVFVFTTRSLPAWAASPSISSHTAAFGSPWHARLSRDDCRVRPRLAEREPAGLHRVPSAVTIAR